MPQTDVLMISVTFHQPDYDLASQWDDLVARARPNVFMSPVALKAAGDSMFAHVHMLLAWDRSVEPQRLVGLWALQERRIFPLWPAVLEALPYEYAFLSSPVVDPAFASQAMPAFIKAIEDRADLPDVMTLRSFDGEAASYAPFVRAIEARGDQLVKLREESRPYARRDTLPKQSGERRKKIRQNWKRLSALGAVEAVMLNEPQAIAAAFEFFLALEMKSWKGSNGTALLCNEADAAFVRRLVHDLAARGEAAIQVLKLNGETIATQVIFFSGSMAYTWKTAFDEDFAKYSPGILLIDKVTELVFADPRIEAIDSCSAESSFMAQIWPGRRAMVDLVVDVGSTRSLAFVMEAGRLQAYERLKQLRNRLRGDWAAFRNRKMAAAPTSQGTSPAAS